MRIVTWNVNGLRAALGKGLVDWLEDEKPDVFCLQELRARPEQLEADHIQRLAEIFPFFIWNPAERPGYSGVAVFARQPVAKVTLGIDIPKYDVEGRVIWLRYPDYNLFNIYFPNGGHDLSRVPFKLDFYSDLLKLCDQLHANGENIVLCGDFNTAHRAIDLKNAKANETISGFLPEERAWIDTYINHGLVDIYRSLYPERVQYTWWTYRMNARQRGVGWRLDYFLVSAGLSDLVVDVVIHEQVMGSDHCPVELVIKDNYPT